VLLRVEDVIVPKRIDGLRRHDRAVRIDGVEVQEPPVPDLCLTRVLEGPSFTLGRIHELDHDWFEVERLNPEENLRLNRPFVRSPWRRNALQSETMNALSDGKVALIEDLVKTD